MKELLRCRMNGQDLADAAPGLHLLDIAENAPERQLTAADPAVGQGQRLLRLRRTQLTVTLTVALAERRFDRRADLLDRLRAWAADGWLEISPRPAQRLNCVLTEAPGLESAWQWAQPVTLTYAALNPPCWQALREAVTRTGPGLLCTARHCPGGTAGPVPLNFRLRNEGPGILTRADVSCRETGTRFSLRGLSLHAGETLAADHTPEGLLTLTAGTGSALHTRTADSADELLLLPGRSNTLTVEADAPVSAEFRSRGWFL